MNNVIACFLIAFTYIAMANESRAWDFYLNKDYVASASHFKSLAQGSPHNFSYHYNLASSYYRLNKYTLAKVHFLHALKINPSDQDTQLNIALINKKMIDQQFLFDKYWGHIMGVNLKELLAILFIISAIFMMVMYTKRHQAHNERIKRSGIIVMFIWGIFVILAMVASATAPSYGVVKEEKIQVFSGPSKTQQALFYAHEGAEYKIIKATTFWLNVQFPNGLKGWVESKYIINI